MEKRIIQITIFLLLVLSFLIASGCLGGASDEKQVSMQEISQRFEEMEKRLLVLEDIEAIKQLQTQYVDFLQQGNYDTVEELFAEDFVMDVGDPGVPPMKMSKKEAGEMYRESMVKSHKGQEGDILTQPIIDLDGDKAKAKWVIYFFYYHPKTYQTLYFVHSWYDMDYQKVDGKWKISRLGVIHNIEPPGGPPNEDTFLNFLDNAQKTMQEMDD